MSKVLFIHHSGILGGAGVSLINIVKYVAKSHDVYVGVSSDPSDIYELLKQVSSENPRIKVFSYGRRIGAITYYSGGDSALSARLFYRLILTIPQRNYWNKKICEINPDVIITNSKILCWMSNLSEIKRRKSICFVRETVKGNPNSFWNKYISKKLDGYNKVVFLSDYDRKLENLKKADTIVVHNFISPDQFDTSITKYEALDYLKIPQKGFYVLYVGGVSEMKGFDLAVEAILQMGADVKLIVAGNDFDQAKKTKSKTELAYANKWQTYISEKDNNHQINFVGRLHDMSNCYAACDVLLFPMRSPHQSRPAFESGLFKKPVIISDFENISEFVRDGRNGYKVAPNSVSAIVEKLSILKNDSKLKENLGHNNYLNTIESHSQEKSCRKIKCIIEE